MILSKIFKTSETKSEEEIVKEIHNEFDTAPDRLLSQALKIIEDNESSKIELESSIEEKAERLKKLGFDNVSIISRVKEIKERNNQKQKVIDEELKISKTIEYYNKTYPFLKFLTEEELERICEKYGLVFAPVSCYIKDIPNKNLEEIENAQRLEITDIEENHTKLFVKEGIRPDTPKEIQEALKTGKFIRKRGEKDFYMDDYYEAKSKIISEININDVIKTLSLYYIFDIPDYKSSIFNDITDPDLKSKEKISNLLYSYYKPMDCVSYEIRKKFRNLCGDLGTDIYFVEKKLESAYNNYIESKIAILRSRFNSSRMYVDFYYSYVADEIEVNREGLFIAAPKSHFDLTNLNKEGKGYFQSKTKTIVKKDPIVFRYCKGGIQILSKWGPEAEIEEIQLPNLN